MFAIERLHLKPLPAWIPEVYRLHQRTVVAQELQAHYIEGYVSVNSNRYSVPVSWNGRRVEVRETKNKIMRFQLLRHEFQLDARNIVTHVRAATVQPQRSTLAEHNPPRGEGVKRGDPHPEEQAILAAAPELAEYVASLKRKSRKVVALAPRQLLRLVGEYPREPLLGAIGEAAQYGLYDNALSTLAPLDRLERMILRRVERDYFLLRKDMQNND